MIKVGEVQVHINYNLFSLSIYIRTIYRLKIMIKTNVVSDEHLIVTQLNFLYCNLECTNQNIVL